MYGNRPAALRDLTDRIEWLRNAVHDPQMNSRLILEGILDVLAVTVELLPGPPVDRGADV